MAASHADGLASDRLAYLANPVWWAGMATSTYAWLTAVVVGEGVFLFLTQSRTLWRTRLRRPS